MNACEQLHFGAHHLNGTAKAVWSTLTQGPVRGDGGNRLKIDERTAMTPIKSDDGRHPAFSDAEPGGRGANATVGERLWMWAHPAGFHDNYFARPNCAGGKDCGYRSRITPVEAAVRMDLRNIMFVYESTDYTHCERGMENTTAHPVSCFPQSVTQLPQYMMPFDSPFFSQVACERKGYH